MNDNITKYITMHTTDIFKVYISTKMFAREGGSFAICVITDVSERY